MQPLFPLAGVLVLLLCFGILWWLGSQLDRQPTRLRPLFSLMMDCSTSGRKKKEQRHRTDSHLQHRYKYDFAILQACAQSDPDMADWKTGELVLNNACRSYLKSVTPAQREADLEYLRALSLIYVKLCACTYPAEQILEDLAGLQVQCQDRPYLKMMLSSLHDLCLLRMERPHTLRWNEGVIVNEYGSN